MKRCKRLLAAILVLLLLPVTALGAGKMDLSAETSLTISSVFGEKAVAGMEFRAYRVSQMDAGGELTVTAPFAAFAEELDIRGENDSAWWDMARQLEWEIVKEPEIKPEATAKTDDTGIARFENLPKGLYLILGESLETDGYVYTTSAFFVMLPSRDAVSNAWNYHVAANAKPAQNPVRADFKVIKIWKDDCHRSQRPKSITIDLLCDGKVYDTITLPQNGRWQYTWHDLDVNCTWSVAEAKLKGYRKPVITKDGNTFTITNTCDKTDTTDKPNLPQSGQLWWPVPILLTTGLLCVVIGLLRRRRAENEA